MDTKGTKNLINQIHENWVKPEIDKRKFKESIFAVLIIFKKDGTEVLFNTETQLTIEIDPAVGGKLTPGKPVTVAELSKHKIKNIKVPSEIFDKYPFIAATTINNYWTIYFNTIPNKEESREKLALAESFIQAANGTSDEKVKSYNIFQALEQAVHAALLGNHIVQEKIKKVKKHTGTKSLVNLQAKQGNIPQDIAQLFNNLHKNRSTIYSREKISKDVSEKDILSIEDFIQSVRKSISQ